MHEHRKSSQQGKLPRGNGEMILLIDDEPEIRKVLRLLLETSGYRVMTADNGVEGLELFRTNQKNIQVIITDMRMKGIQGTDVIKELRNIDIEARILAVSGFRTHLDLIPEEPGRLIFLHKPMSRAELIGAVQSMLH